MQKTQYDQQLAEYKARIASFDAKVQETDATIAKYQADEARYRDREDVAQQIQDIKTTLAEHGTGSKINMLASQDQRLELVRSLDFAHNSLTEAEQTRAALVADRDAYATLWQAQMSRDLVTARNNLDIARSQMEKAGKREDLVRLTASEDSVVLTVAKLSVGSVLKQADALMTLMPLDAPVEAEINIAARDIGFVRPNDPCTLKIGAFNYMEHGVGRGRHPLDQRQRLHHQRRGPGGPGLLPGPVQRRRDALSRRAGEFPADPGHDGPGGPQGRQPFRRHVPPRRVDARVRRVDARAMR